MPRGWPPLSIHELLDVLRALGFQYARSTGGHDFYTAERHGTKYKVTVDPKCAPFSVDLLKSMCSQAGCSRKDFYGATPRTAAKIR